MLKLPVDNSRGAVRGAGLIKECQRVGSASLEGAADAPDLDERGRDTAGDGVGHGLHQLLADGFGGVAVRGVDALVDASGRFGLGVFAMANTASSQAFCLSVSRSAPV